MIKYFEKLDSTNQYIMRNVYALDHLTVVVAQTQTQGKGQYGRTWKSDQSSNLYMSLLLKGDSRLPAVIRQLTLYSSLVTVECIQEFINPAYQHIAIRWPNDVLVNSKKIAGILAESSWQGNELLYAVLGVGLNINMSQEELAQIDQPATSLNHCSMSYVHKEDILHSWLKLFSATWESFLTVGLDQAKLEQYIVGQPDMAIANKAGYSKISEKNYTNYINIIEGRSC